MPLLLLHFDCCYHCCYYCYHQYCYSRLISNFLLLYIQRPRTTPDLFGRTRARNPKSSSSSRRSKSRLTIFCPTRSPSSLKDPVQSTRSRLLLFSTLQAGKLRFVTPFDGTRLKIRLVFRLVLKLDATRFFSTTTTIARYYRHRTPSKSPRNVQSLNTLPQFLPLSRALIVSQT